MLRAVIFDIDGTLVDSVDLHARAWQEAFRHFGREIPFEQIRSQIGKGGDQLLPVFLSEAEIRKFGKELEEYRSNLFKREYLPLVRPFPKVRELFEKLRSDGKQIALASSAKGDELEAYKINGSQESQTWWTLKHRRMTQRVPSRIPTSSPRLWLNLAIPTPRKSRLSAIRHTMPKPPGS